MSVQRLIDALNRMIELHTELLSLADRKRQAIVMDAVDEVSAITNKETKLMRGIDEALREQVDATNDFFRARGFQTTRQVTVTELSRVITDPAEKDALLASRDRLFELVALLKQKNELNQQLMKQSLAFINYFIDAVIGPDDEPVYRNPATQKPTTKKRSGFFDSKA